MKYLKSMRAGIAVGLGLIPPLFAHSATEAPSTVDAAYVQASVRTALAPGEKIGWLYTLNATTPYVLQKLTDRVYFFQSGFYGTVFYVGDRGVLVFDALENRSAALKAAIAEVTKLPITAIVYSHNHADHIADAKVLRAQNPQLRIIATEATTASMKRLHSRHPAATEIVDSNTRRFEFEKLNVRVVPLDQSGHAHDHAVFILEGTGVVHVPDVINPDQPPFWSFAGADSYMGYRGMVEQIGALDWQYLSGGHGNVGSKADVAFYLRFLGDLEAAVGEALGKVPWGTGIKEPASLNAHTAYLPAWLDAVSKYATDKLRPVYGKYYGFEHATPTNAARVAMYLFSYR